MAELAAGALSGWVYTLATKQPDAAKRIGLKSAPRVRQWHLDLAMLGTAAVAAGTAVPDAPARAALPLAVGCWTNAMLFLPLAVRTDLDEHPAYQGAAVASFATTTVGFTRMAACAWRNR
jgi:hypothetical protein